MSENQWKDLAELVLSNIPEDTTKQLWKKQPDLLEKRLNEILSIGPGILFEWVTFYKEVLNYELDISKIHYVAKPPISNPALFPIVVPSKWDIAKKISTKWESFEWGVLGNNDYSFATGIYRKCLDIFPYKRRTPLADWQAYCSSVHDFPERPNCKQTYMIWVEIPDFKSYNSVNSDEADRKWERRWDTPGTTLAEQLLLELFWWHKYSKPVGIQREKDWTLDNTCTASSILCSGSRIKEGSELYNKYSSYWGKTIIPTTDWGHGGFYVSKVGYKTATTPSPYPCLIIAS
jgi:hypothetical protein